MKSYLGLVFQYEKVHRKNNRISILCIVISVLLVTTIFSMADMALRAQRGYFIKTNGEYHIGLTGLALQDAERMAARPDVALCGWTYQGCMGAIGQKTVSFAGANEATFRILTEMKLQSGAYPERPDEALLNQAAMEQLGLAPGDRVVVTAPNGSEKEYVVTGVLENMGSLLKADIYGMVLSEEGFREIADESAGDGTTFRIQFKSGVNIPSAIRQIKETYGLADGQVGENTALLGLMGQSENSTMRSLYIVAAVLVLLVLVAGTVMIAAGFNTNLLERVRFYGLLRCLGASQKQVRHFVILQGFSQSMKGVPLGLMAGQLVTWCACLLLKSISGERFSEIPLFRCSISGLAAGAAVGFLIVFLASLSPAQKAAKVSPVAAISSAGLARNRKAANTKLFRVETDMGIFHALSGKKNVFLMTCSFAISIMMFLSFQVMVVFLNQGMPALLPSAPDISITGGGLLNRALTEEIGRMDGVENTFGRMEKAHLPVRVGESDGTVTLISYDDIEFQWLKEGLIEGSIGAVTHGADSVLITRQKDFEWNAGDTIIIRGEAGERKVTVSGVLAAANAINSPGSYGYVVCSENTFRELAGDMGYAVIDVQLFDAGDDDTAAAIRNIIPEGSIVSDKRLSNSESQSAYYTGAVFIYGFLLIIALITVFNIFNSMNASVASRTRQYGIMRSIGMGMGQLYKMIAAEAFTYALLGCAAGCLLGLPLNKIMFDFLIAGKWGIGWSIPVKSLLLIVCVCLLSAAIAIRRPIKQISKMAIVDTVKCVQ